MKVHVFKHTGVKPYECPYPGCLKRFTESGNRNQHYRAVHFVSEAWSDRIIEIKKAEEEVD